MHQGSEVDGVVGADGSGSEGEHHALQCSEGEERVVRVQKHPVRRAVDARVLESLDAEGSVSLYNAFSISFYRFKNDRQGASPLLYTRFTHPLASKSTRPIFEIESKRQSQSSSSTHTHTHTHSHTIPLRYHTVQRFLSLPPCCSHQNSHLLGRAHDGFFSLGERPHQRQQLQPLVRDVR